MIQQAIDIYNNELKYQNESARAVYKLGCVRLDDGDVELGNALIEEAKERYLKIIPGVNTSELDEGDFDRLIMAWSR